MEFKKQLQEAVKSALFDLSFEGVEPLIEHPDDLEHGDYSTNIAMTIFSKLQITNSKFRLNSKLEIKKFKTPLELAEKIKEKLETGPSAGGWKLEIIDKVDVVSPGFINFHLSTEVLSKELSLALTSGERYPSSTLRASLPYGATDLGKGKKIVVEYSSPNIAKRFGIGHLRSTIIGQSIYNIYQFLGFRPIGDNHLGDWGTQFGVMIYQIVSQKVDVSRLSVDQLEVLYVDFNTRAKENPELWEEARKWFKKLEDGDEEAQNIWKSCVEVSTCEFNKIYELLDVKIDNTYGESFYQDKMTAIIEEAKSKKLAVESEGALIIPFEGMPPGILLKSDRATTYFTRDLATIKFRLREWDPKKIIYEVGVEQTLHFQQVFKAAELLGWVVTDKLVHVKHGLYLSPDGKKFSTRRGETVRLEEVLEQAIEKASHFAAPSPKRLWRVGDEASRDEGGDLAKAVGVGAIKYFDLSHQPSSNIVFSWDKIFLLTGNSGPYLQYTYARTCSILRKSQITSANWRTKSQTNYKFKIANLEKEELQLLRTFYRFPEVVEMAAIQYSPNLLCNFLYDLASKYNLLYNNLSILGEGRESMGSKGDVREFRLALTAVTANILKTGLGLLGIQAPERM